ncbi:MAG: choice-of-anchor D domain-containing protein, partial [Casimicrobiaceae bacterium]
MLRQAVGVLLFAVCALAADAFAGGRICITRDIIVFGNLATGSVATQSSVVSNCGDQPWTLTDVSIHPATAPSYRVATSCTTGRALAPAEACSIDVTFAPITPGQVSGGVWLHNSTSTPDQIVTFYGRGVDVQAGSATLQFMPGTLSFAGQAVGTTSPLQTLVLRNLGPSTLTLKALVLNGPNALDFRAPGNCMLGVPIPAGGTCELYVNFTPSAVGSRSAKLNVDAPELATLGLLSIVGNAIASGPTAVDIIEFYNAPLNHYFLTAVPEEATAIDQGEVGPHWLRTGLSFRSYAPATTLGNAVDV